MLIVSDTGPLRYLIEIECSDVLPRLYGRILTPPEVMAELRQAHFPASVHAWATHPPSWLQAESPAKIQFLDTLDAGEAAALSLAIECHADVLLVDERKATRVARESGVITVGTLGVLRDAALDGLIDFRAPIHRLAQSTRFHHDKALIDQVTADFDLQQRQRPT